MEDIVLDSSPERHVIWPAAILLTGAIVVLIVSVCVCLYVRMSHTTTSILGATFGGRTERIWASSEYDRRW